MNQTTKNRKTTNQTTKKEYEPAGSDTAAPAPPSVKPAMPGWDDISEDDWDASPPEDAPSEQESSAEPEGPGSEQDISAGPEAAALAAEPRGGKVWKEPRHEKFNVGVMIFFGGSRARGGYVREECLRFALLRLSLS